MHSDYTTRVLLVEHSNRGGSLTTSLGSGELLVIPTNDRDGVRALVTAARWHFGVKLFGVVPDHVMFAGI